MTPAVIDHLKQCRICHHGLCDEGRRLWEANVCQPVEIAHADISSEAQAAPPEFGWLLERNMTPDGPECICVEGGFLVWTTDNLKALRLAWREDADKLAEIVDDCEHVREHQWG